MSSRYNPRCSFSFIYSEASAIHEHPDSTAVRLQTLVYWEEICCTTWMDVSVFSFKFQFNLKFVNVTIG